MRKGGTVCRKIDGGASSDQSISNSEDGDSSVMIMTNMSLGVKCHLNINCIVVSLFQKAPVWETQHTANL
jgi:hypothetical protein